MKQPPVIVVQVVHIQGPLQGSIQEFATPEISIGRDPACDIHFPVDLTVISRRHAQIAREGNRFRLVDSSTNGTLVNGKPVKEAYLKDGDVITLAQEGPKLSFLTRLAQEGEKVVVQPRQAVVEAPVYQPSPPAAVPRPAPAPVSVPPPAPPLAPPPELTPAPPQQVVAAPLVVQYGPTLRCFDNLPVKIGRGSLCGVVIDQSGMSEEQALFYFAEARYWVKDLTGTGAVLVNGNPARTGVALQSNDRIMLSPGGPVFRFLGEGRLVEEEMEALGGRGNTPAEARIELKPAEKESSKGSLSFLKKFFHDD